MVKFVTIVFLEIFFGLQNHLQIMLKILSAGSPRIRMKFFGGVSLVDRVGMADPCLFHLSIGELVVYFGV